MTSLQKLGLGFVAVLAAGGLAVAGYCVCYFVWGETAPAPGAKEAATAKPGPLEPMGTDQKETQSIHALLNALGEAVKKSDEKKIEASLDVDRMVQEMTRQQVLPALVPEAQTRLVQELKSEVPRDMIRQAPLLRWDRLEVKRVQFQDDRSEAVVFTRQWQDDAERNARASWWLKKRGGRWRIYDFADLDSNVRMSTSAGLTRGQDDADLAKSLQQMLDASQELLQQDFVSAREKLAALDRVQFPPPLEAVRWMLKGYLALGQGPPEEALVDFDKAQSFQPDLPLLNYFRAVAYNQAGQPEKALEHGRNYVALMGNDADAYQQIGLALMSLEKPEEAGAAFRKGLEDYPESVANLAGLRKVLPPDKKTELARWFAKLGKPQDHFEGLANDALTDKDAVALEVLSEAYRKAAPADPAADYFVLRAKILQMKFDEAIPLFKMLLPRVTDEEKHKEYLNGFLTAMLAAGRPIEAFEAAPDPGYAFRFLANSLLADEKKDELNKLIEAQRRRQPDNPWSHFYAGKLHELDGAFAKAESDYALGMAKPLPPEDQEHFRANRVYAAFKAGKGLAAHDEIGPKKKTFDQLAPLFAEAKDAKQLEALVAAQRKHEPKDEDLLPWEIEVLWLRQEYDKLVPLLNENRQVLLASNKTAWLIYDRLIRSLVRLKQLDKALEEAAALAKNEKDSLMLAVVSAAGGDVPKTSAALAQCLEEGRTAKDFYADPDLGPLLRTEPFRGVREKYPEPADQPALDP